MPLLGRLPDNSANLQKYSSPAGFEKVPRAELGSWEMRAESPGEIAAVQLGGEIVGSKDEFAL
jgi:hypothetical protein